MKKYTRGRNVWVGWFLAGNQGSQEPLTDFHGNEAFFLNGRLKKNWDF